MRKSKGDNKAIYSTWNGIVWAVFLRLVTFTMSFWLSAIFSISLGYTKFFVPIMIFIIVGITIVDIVVKANHVDLKLTANINAKLTLD